MCANQDELVRLTRENETLKKERDLSTPAAAFFTLAKQFSPNRPAWFLCSQEWVKVRETGVSGPDARRRGLLYVELWLSEGPPAQLSPQVSKHR